MQLNGRDLRPSEFVANAASDLNLRTAANIVSSAWRELEEESSRAFTIVPRWAMRLPEVDWVDAGLIAVIYRDDRRDPNHKFYKSMSSFAKELGFGRTTVHRHLEKLEDLGIITKTRKPGARGSFVWHLNPVRIVEILG